MAFNQYAKTERDFTTLLNSANMTPADRDKLSAVLASLVGFQATQPGTNESIDSGDCMGGSEGKWEVICVIIA